MTDRAPITGQIRGNLIYDGRQWIAMLIKMFTIAHVLPELEQKYLQHLRDFDVAHPGCHFEIGIDAPNAPFAEMLERIKVEPGLTFSQIFERKAPDPIDSLCSMAIEDALRAVLLFHSGGEWNTEKRAEWKRITGSDEATTKALCDHIRAALDFHAAMDPTREPGSIP